MRSRVSSVCASIHRLVHRCVCLCAAVCICAREYVGACLCMCVCVCSVICTQPQRSHGKVLVITACPVVRAIIRAHVTLTRSSSVSGVTNALLSGSVTLTTIRVFNVIHVVPFGTRQNRTPALGPWASRSNRRHATVSWR